MVVRGRRAVNRAERRRYVRAGEVLIGVCIDGDQVTEIPVEGSQVIRLMRAEGLSFEEAWQELVAAGCPICHPQNRRN